MLAHGARGAGGGTNSLSKSEVECYVELVGTPFRLRETSGAVCEILLDRVDVRPASRCVRSGRVPFSLTFRGPAGRVIPQDVYWLDHAVLGRSRLLLVPIGPRRDRATLEAVFG